MTIETRSTNVVLDAQSGKQQIERAHVQFSGKVLRADGALKGFRIQFAGDGVRDAMDHDVHVEAIGIQNIEPQGTVVKFEVFLSLQDEKDDFLDRYRGAAEVVIVAQVE